MSPRRLNVGLVPNLLFNKDRSILLFPPVSIELTMDSFLESVRSMQRSPRLKIVTPVKISFEERGKGMMSACTYEISLTGVRISHVRGIEAVDQSLWIHRKNLKAKYEVTWIGGSSTPEANQVGARLMEPDNIIWEESLKNQLCS